MISIKILKLEEIILRINQCYLVDIINYFALWWRSLDKPLLFTILILLLASIVFSYLSTLGFASNKIFNDSTILLKSIFFLW